LNQRPWPYEDPALTAELRRQVIEALRLTPLPVVSPTTVYTCYKQGGGNGRGVFTAPAVNAATPCRGAVTLSDDYPTAHRKPSKPCPDLPAVSPRRGRWGQDDPLEFRVVGASVGSAGGPHSGGSAARCEVARVLLPQVHSDNLHTRRQGAKTIPERPPNRKEGCSPRMTAASRLLLFRFLSATR
jgi:hypothetical protein